MKAKAALLILIVVILGLGIGLIVLNRQATTDREMADKTITVMSNNIVAIQNSLSDEQSVRMALETNLATTKLEYSNKLAATETSLATTSAALLKTQAEAKAAAETAAATIADRDKKIIDLESQNQLLDKESADLRTSITNLENQITITKHKLDTSEGEREFLVKELKRLQAEKADLERKFNDLAILREQVRKIKAELSLSRRLDWVRRGIYGASTMKGGERMLRGPQTLPASTNKALNVEFRQDGTVNIQGVPATNAPAAH